MLSVSAVAMKKNIVFIFWGLCNYYLALAAVDYKITSTTCVSPLKNFLVVNVCEVTERQMFLTLNYTKPLQKILVSKTTTKP